MIFANIDVPFIKYEINNRNNILKMIKSGRIDYFLDNDADLTRAKDKFFPGDDFLVIRDLIHLKLYPAFSNTPKGQALKETWDQRMSKIQQSTKMMNLFKKWDIIYRFDNSK